MIYAVIDTNVLVSALITKNPEAATAKVGDGKGQVTDILWNGVNGFACKVAASITILLYILIWVQI